MAAVADPDAYELTEQEAPSSEPSPAADTGQFTIAIRPVGRGGPKITIQITNLDQAQLTGLAEMVLEKAASLSR